jgi:hypothetical protein
MYQKGGFLRQAHHPLRMNRQRYLPRIKTCIKVKVSYLVSAMLLSFDTKTAHSPAKPAPVRGAGTAMTTYSYREAVAKSEVWGGVPESIFWGGEARAEIDGAVPSGSGLPNPSRIIEIPQQQNQ